MKKNNIRNNLRNTILEVGNKKEFELGQTLRVVNVKFRLELRHSPKQSYVDSQLKNNTIVFDMSRWVRSDKHLGGRFRGGNVRQDCMPHYSRCFSSWNCPPRRLESLSSEFAALRREGKYQHGF